MCVVLVAFNSVAFAQDARITNPDAESEAVRSATHQPAPGQIKHVVYIMKENRSFDHYFGQYPGADGTTTGVISTGQSFPLFRAPDVMFHDGDHNYDSALTAENGGKMDQFDLSNWGNENGDFQAYSQMTQADIPNYWAYAQNFVLSDHTFESDNSPSFNAHFYTVAATGEGSTTVPQLAGHTLASWGCDTLPAVTVTLFDSVGAYYDTFPCFNSQTMADSLNNASPSPLTWKFYGPLDPQGGYEHSAFDYIQHIRYGNQWTTNVVPYNQFVTDAEAGNLPAVSWIIADSAETEHPPNGTCNGENWTVKQINAIMNGPAEQWNSTVIYVTWDEWGGFYDHVQPPYVDQWGFGIRVPMLIISPYALKGHVTHTTYEFSSPLKFIEENWNLPPLTDRDENANDTTDSFNFSQNPLPPMPLQQRQCPVLNTTIRNWSNVPVGKSVVLPITVTNWSSSAMTIGAMTTTGNFKVSSGGTCTTSLAAGKQCLIKVAFTPKGTGVQTGTLKVTDGGPNSPQTVNLTGVGTAIQLPIHYPGLNFSLTDMGATTQQSVQLSNTSSSAVTINQIQVIGDYSETDNCGSSLAGGASCNITVTFSPTVSGYRKGSLVIWDDDPGSPQMGRLVGTATSITQKPDTLTFSSPVGQKSAAQNITITNVSNVPLIFENVTIKAPFAATNNCPANIAAGAQCTISVTFTPAKSGQVTQTMNLNDGDFLSPQNVFLTGNGTTAVTTAAKTE